MSVEGLIRRAREHARINQRELAERLGLTYQTVSKIEQAPNPSPAVLSRYGAAMGYVLVIRFQAQAADGTEIIIE